MADTSEEKKVIGCLHNDLENENEMQTSPEINMYDERSSKTVAREEIECNGNENEGFDYDDNNMDHSSTGFAHKFDIVLQLKMIEEMKQMRAELQTLRINSMIIKEEIRTNTMLTKLLWSTLNSTDTQFLSPTTRQRAEDNNTDEI